MSIIYSPLISFLRTQKVSDISNWELFIRQARSANLLSKVALILYETEQYDDIPIEVEWHFFSALKIAKANKLSFSREYKILSQIFQENEFEISFLKGVAYQIKGINAGNGRVFSDIDILVRKKDIRSVEVLLAQNGWRPSSFDTYYQKYYRKWMHELPPLKHTTRRISLDVHHNILPPTAELKPDVEKIWDDSIQINDSQFVKVLSPIDMVLHSATHLFHEGEFDNGLRDISDIDFMLKEFQALENFWDNLINRAEELKIERPLFYGLRYSYKILNTSIPTEIMSSKKLLPPNFLLIEIMDFLFLRSLMPNHNSCNDKWTGFARWVLYIRSHWLRMPLYLLIPHLLRKSWLKLMGNQEIY